MGVIAVDPWLRFWPKVAASDSDECWIWQAFCNRRGYGQFYYKGSPRLAHRVVYEWFVGPIPEGLSLDHLCRNPPCVNPRHLEAVPIAVNVNRAAPWIHPNHIWGKKTHCPKGHEYTPENTYRHKNHGRVCRTCRIEKGRVTYAKIKAARDA